MKINNTNNIFGKYFGNSLVLLLLIIVVHLALSYFYLYLMKLSPLENTF